jgi:hypothetical protein
MSAVMNESSAVYNNSDEFVHLAIDLINVSCEAQLVGFESKYC